MAWHVSTVNVRNFAMPAEIAKRHFHDERGTMRRNQLMMASLLVLASPATAVAQGIDPPTRVGRVSAMEGTLSLFATGATDWTAASLNYPLTTGDALWADGDARAEVHLGSSAVRIAPLTSLVFGEISDTVTQVRLDEGTVDVHVRYLSTDEIYEVDTPSGVVSLLDQGHYRIDVTPDGRRTTLTVRDGSGEISVGDRDYQVRAGTSATLIGPDRPPITAAAVPQDDWERWADGRDRREDAVQSTRYVSRDMVGYEDLDDYGSWQVESQYGAVWYPRGVPAGWAPYRYGHWESVEPWGWTWIDDEPWGFAPFHYGRWAWVRGRWGWVPGETRLRPVYAPAQVAFVGGEGGGSVSFGGGAAVGWVPLAPGEPFVPAYRSTPAYVSRINLNLGPLSIGLNLGRPEIDRVPLANRTVPGAVTAVPRDAFEHARPVGRAAIDVRPADVATIRPSAVPVAAGQPLPTPRTPPVDRGRGGRAEAPHPPGLPAGQVAPPPPPQFRGRPRPNGMEPVRPTTPPPPPQVAPPQVAPPPPPPGPPDQGRGHPPRPQPPPPPVQPPPDRGHPPVQPPPPQPVQPAPPPVQPVPPPPPDRGRGRGRGRQPDQPAPPPPAAPAPPPTAGGSAGQVQQQWILQRKQLIARQQQEDADLAARQQAQLKQLPPGASAAHLQQQQQNEKRAQDERHQRERDQLDKQFRKPN